MHDIFTNKYNIQLLQISNLIINLLTLLVFVSNNIILIRLTAKFCLLNILLANLSVYTSLI